MSDATALIERCEKSTFVTVTREILDAGQSRKGGWSREQLELLGVDWPPVRGWPARVVGARSPGSDVAAFLRLKDAHLPGVVPGLFDAGAKP